MDSCSHRVAFTCILQVMGIRGQSFIDPYVKIDVDDVSVRRTQTKPKTAKPIWNEEFCAEVHSGKNLGFTIFHDAAIPPDEFVANCTVAFEDIEERKSNDFWVRLFLSDLTYRCYCLTICYY